MNPLFIIWILLFCRLAWPAEIVLEPARAGAGKTVFIRLDGDGSQEPVKIKVFDKKKTLFYSDGSHSNHIGISLKTEPGKYTVSFGDTEKQLEVFDPGYPSETIEIPDPETIDVSVINKESRIIGRVLSTVTRKKLRSSDFIMPVKYTRVSSSFGAKRVYNDGQVAWQHKGIDLVNKIGAPVVASNSGRVVLSEKMKIHGNIIIIDHGQGIFTIYNHLDRRVAKKNVSLKKGQRIGTLGKSGLVTGPHLHFGVSVSNERVDPADWLK